MFSVTLRAIGRLSLSSTRLYTGAAAATLIPSVKEVSSPIVGELKKQQASNDVDHIRNELKDTKDRLMRALAETENVRLRWRKEVTDTKKYGGEKMAKSLLDVVDTLDMAIASVPEEELSSESLLKTFHDGVAMTHTMFIKGLADQGVVQINPEGETFDYHKHQALFEIDDPSKEPGTIGDRRAHV
eukprot:TRINITY_DN5114_c0_g1_i1.p1 TRINITY_DN5114_c0_g1~~TRINITY_DN5114_c0_g1_i1.p1  ORF type:complete len:186 (-),score=50.46 TRINITY_DN5114_c0_g1_i1:18-575(-)